ncbi:hypothetical protein [Glaesserella parasuis]|uniref:hypothetical protein n=1 Tax=Glaesserella parasuis TaxID=738 RepID=UPI0021C0880F|nr:hypothetical protein [Glaesserella parasuis]MDO9749705.1 hypothetical protein [Glaesserella parasuis]MDO9780293.1 hypothetical protein [Glaesserella parasuis]
MNFDQAIELLEKMLKERTNDSSYSWGRKQDNSSDKKTDFIYGMSSYSALLRRCEAENLDSSLTEYAKNRWLNFKSANAIEAMFSQHKFVKKESNPYHQYIDFYINGINFDHKTSQFPKGFGHDLNYAKEHKKEIIEWLYRNQSRERRMHFENRLFVILYDKKNSQHWKLKSNLKEIYAKITDYLDNFDKNNLIALDQGLLRDGKSNNKIIYSDVIWYIS